MNRQFIQGLSIDWSKIDSHSYLREIEALNQLEEVVFEKPITFFVGENGSGKSTLLKLIAGAAGSLRYTGMLNIKSGLKLSFVTQNIDSLIGRPEQLERSNGADLTLFMNILIKLGFTRAQLDKDLSELSRGQRKKTALALSLAQSAHLYVWDEPLNYIDVMSRLAIEELILSFKPTLLFVEHDAEFVKKIADKIICLQA